MIRLLATYLAYKWAMRTVNNHIKYNGESNYGYNSRYSIFQCEYEWMYNILNPKM